MVDMAVPSHLGASEQCHEHVGRHFMHYASTASILDGQHAVMAEESAADRVPLFFFQIFMRRPE
jgi:hypothetical protein